MTTPDLLTESPLTLAQAGVTLRTPTGTVRRWATVGVRGVRLEAVRVGGRLRTSTEAVARFLDRLNGGEPGPVRAAGLADRELQRAGL